MKPIISEIAEQAKRLLPPQLHAVLDDRVRRGVEKYHHTLDEYGLSKRRAAVNELQEALDGLQYSIVGESPLRPVQHAELAIQILEDHPDLTFEEMTAEEHGLVNWKEEYKSLVLAVQAAYGAHAGDDPYELLQRRAETAPVKEPLPVFESLPAGDVGEAITQAMRVREQERQARDARRAESRKRWQRTGDE